MESEIIVENGSYYFPAWRHYGNPNIKVRCNNCLKNELSVCIGYQNKDLCMSCVDSIANTLFRGQELPPTLTPAHLNPAFLNQPFKPQLNSFKK
jgi:hypothetical protein